MLAEFEKTVAAFFTQHDAVHTTDKILLALSGGADSIALLYAFSALKRDGFFKGDFVCAHINHQLRGCEADADEDFVVEQVKELNLEMATRRIDVRGFAAANKLSIETAARKLRIKNLTDIARTTNCDWIATAHHKDDNAETVVQRLARGTGFRGLGGIWPVRKIGGAGFIRPLICLSRKNIIEYLQSRDLKWCVDRTNLDCGYRRNYIRHRLLPALQKDCTDRIPDILFELSCAARGFYHLVCSYADKLWLQSAQYCGDEVKLDLRSVSEQVLPVKVELLRRCLATVGSGEAALTQGHYDKILQLAAENVSGKSIELPGGFTVRRQYGKLIFSRPAADEQPETKRPASMEIEIPGRTRFGTYLIEAMIFQVEMGGFERFRGGKNSFIEWFDLDSIKLPLVIRFRRAGDRFVPLGLASEKKISRFLIAARVPRRIRDGALIVGDVEKIIWLWPIRISEQTRITDGTKRILQLQITNARTSDK